MKKKKIKISKNKFILRIKKIILFDDTELFEEFEEQDYTDIPNLTEDEIDNMIEELKNS